MDGMAYRASIESLALQLALPTPYYCIARTFDRELNFGGLAVQLLQSTKLSCDCPQQINTRVLTCKISSHC